VLLDECSAELVDYPRAELAEQLHSAEAVEHLHLDGMVDQQQQHLNLKDQMATREGGVNRSR
jgi:hypothetical protein